MAGSKPARGRRGAAGATDARADPALTRDAVLTAALALLDEAGVEGFSVRNLARKLGVFPTAIYWHVPGREALLSGVVSIVLRDLAPPDEGVQWQDWIRRLFQRYREHVRRHPNVAPLIGAHLVHNAEPDLAMIEATLAVLTRAGFRGASLVSAYNAVIAAMVGFTTLEFGPLPAEDREDWQGQVREAVHSVDPDAHPHLAANAPMMSNRAFIVRWQNGTEAPLDDGFRTYCDIVLAGLERLAGHERGS